MLITVIFIIAFIFIFALIQGLVKSKESRNTIKLVHDYQKEICGFQTGSLYCSIDDKVFLSVDETREKLCEIIWNSGNPTHKFIDDFYPSKTYLALSQQEDMKGIIHPSDCKIFKIDPFAILKSMQELKGFSIDEKNMKICLLKLGSSGLSHKVIGFNSLMACEIVEDGVSVTKTSRSSQAGGALLGGILLGGTGAIIGGLSGKKQTSQELQSISLRLTINDLDNPVYDYLLNVKHLKANPAYKKSVEELAHHWHAVMEILIKRADMTERQIP